MCGDVLLCDMLLCDVLWYVVSCCVVIHGVVSWYVALCRIVFGHGVICCVVSYRLA